MGSVVIAMDEQWKIMAGPSDGKRYEVEHFIAREVMLLCFRKYLNLAGELYRRP
jgi:hypothetical protein